MARNIEIKAYVKNPKKLFKLASDLANSSPQILSQTDTFFPVEHGRLKLREMDQRAELIFYNRPNTPQPSLSEYHRLDVSSQPMLKFILMESLGVKGIIRKRRCLFIKDQTRIHLDEVEGLGHFMELEVVLKENQTEEAGASLLREFMSALEISSGNLIQKSYLDLLLDEQVKSS